MKHGSHAAKAFLCRMAAPVAILVTLVTAAAAGADGGPTPAATGIAGIVPATSTGTLHRHGVSETATPAALRAASRSSTGGLLNWHGGPVMHSNTTYVVYWSPADHPIPAADQATVTQYLQDVAHDSGGNGNVYSITPEYTDSSSRAAYDSTFGGSWVDTTPIPPTSNCNGQYGSRYTVHGCLLDTDLQDSIARAIAANGWPAGASSAFFVMTPPGVGSCADTTSRSCAYRSYCAYHSFFSRSGEDVPYADLPYPDASSVGAGGVCDTGQQPNGDWGDETINLLSHEHNEMITDPLLNAWYDNNGNEDGDKCAWNYGTILGGGTGLTGSEGDAWNQLINGHHYFLQREWSNSVSSCLQRSADLPDTPVVLTVSPGSGPPGTAVTITGAHLGSATAVKFTGSKAAFTVVDDKTITTTVPANATTGPISVITPIGTAKSPVPFTVAAMPVDFSIAVDGPQTVTAGQDVTYTVTLTRLTTFTGSVSLAVQVGPDAVMPPIASFSPRTIADGTTTTTLSVKTRKVTTLGTFTLTITATKGDVVRTATTGITVNPAPAKTKNRRNAG